MQSFLVLCLAFAVLSTAHARVGFQVELELYAEKTLVRLGDRRVTTSVIPKATTVYQPKDQAGQKAKWKLTTDWLSEPTIKYHSDLEIITDPFEDDHRGEETMRKVLFRFFF